MRIPGICPLLAPLLAVPAVVGSAAGISAQEGGGDPGSGDPREEFVGGIEARMRRHPFFKLIRTSRIDDHPPFVLFVQQPLEEAPNHARAVAQAYGPWMQELEKIFLEEYARPLELEDSGAPPAHVLVVLSSYGDYVNFSRLVPSTDLNAERALYDPGLEVAVSYRDTFYKRGEHDERRPALHELVHALQRRFHAVPTRLPPSAFLVEGLAEYLSFHLGLDPGALRRHPIDSHAAADFLAMHASEDDRETYLHRIGDLVRFRGAADIHAEVARRCGERGVTFQPRRALAAFHVQAYLLTHYLHHGEDGAHRQRFGRFARSVLAGGESGEAFQEAFEGVNLPMMDGRLVSYARGAYREHLEQYAGADPAASAAQPAPGAAQPPAGESPAPPEPQPAEDLLGALALEADEIDARLGLALVQGLRGEMEAAASGLEAAREAIDDAALRRWADAETLRWRRWDELRRGYAEDLARSGARLRIALDGESLSAPVLACEGGVLRLGENRQGIEQLPLSALDPVLLLQLLPRESIGDSRKWMRIHPYCVSGDGKWRKLLSRDRDPELEVLRGDAQSLYPRLLAAGSAAAGLERLRELGWPADAASARERTDALADLWREHAAADCVARRKASLEGLAAACFEIQARELELQEFSSVAASPRDGGAVLLSYDFSDEVQGEDFVRDDDLLSELRPNWGPLASKADEPFAVHDGALVARGAHGTRHRLEFEAPLRLRYRVRWDALPGEPEDQYRLYAGLCHRTAWDHVLFTGIWWLKASDSKGRQEVDGEENKSPLFPGREYEVELRHDGSRIEARVDGDLRGSLAAEGLTAGKILFCVHSDVRVRISEVEIEGRVRAASLEDCRRAWVDRQVRALGLR